MAMLIPIELTSGILNKDIGYGLRVAETNKSTILLVFGSVFRVAPKVTYNKYAPFDAP